MNHLNSFILFETLVYIILNMKILTAIYLYLILNHVLCEEDDGCVIPVKKVSGPRTSIKLVFSMLCYGERFDCLAAISFENTHALAIVEWANGYSYGTLGGYGWAQCNDILPEYHFFNEKRKHMKSVKSLLALSDDLTYGIMYECTFSSKSLDECNVSHVLQEKLIAYFSPKTNNGSNVTMYYGEGNVLSPVVTGGRLDSLKANASSIFSRWNDVYTTVRTLSQPEEVKYLFRTKYGDVNVTTCRIWTYSPAPFVIALRGHGLHPVVGSVYKGWFITYGVVSNVTFSDTDVSQIKCVIQCPVDNWCKTIDHPQFERENNDQTANDTNDNFYTTNINTTFNDINTFKMWTIVDSSDFFTSTVNNTDVPTTQATHIVNGAIQSHPPFFVTIIVITLASTSSIFIILCLVFMFSRQARIRIFDLQRLRARYRSIAKVSWYRTREI